MSGLFELGVDGTLVKWCLISAVAGAVVYGLYHRLFFAAGGDTYVFESGRDAYDYGKERQYGE